MTRKRTEISYNLKSKICETRKKNQNLTLTKFSQIIKREFQVEVGKSTLSDSIQNPPVPPL